MSDRLHEKVKVLSRFIFRFSTFRFEYDDTDPFSYRILPSRLPKKYLIRVLLRYEYTCFKEVHDWYHEIDRESDQTWEEYCEMYYQVNKFTDEYFIHTLRHVPFHWKIHIFEMKMSGRYFRKFLILLSQDQLAFLINWKKLATRRPRVRF